MPKEVRRRRKERRWRAIYSEASPSTGALLHLFGDDVGGTVGAAQHGVGFVVVEDLLGFRVKAEAATEAVAGVGEVHQRCGLVGFFDGGVDIFGAAAAAPPVPLPPVFLIPYPG